MIQVSFRAYLIRKSQALRALRELAVAKAKLNELRALFNNFTYRRRLTLNAEERQKFSERIIVLLLTVDAIEVMFCVFILFQASFRIYISFGVLVFDHLIPNILHTHIYTSFKIDFRF